MSDTEAKAVNKQYTMREWIGREVLYCVSTLVYELARGEHMDDLMEVCVQDDWEEPAEDIINDMPREQIVDILEGEYSVQCYDHETIEELRTALMVNLKDEDRLQQFCNDLGIHDPHQNEAYEHWLVSNWFAERLKEKGEMVIDDFLGLTIWGRCCTGQAIYLDCVVEEIYDEMMARRT